MASKLMRSYTFVAASRTVQLTDIPTGELRLDSLLAIFNETTGVMMYAPGGAASVSGTPVTATVSGNTITLSAVAAGMSNSDSLTVKYEVPDKIAEQVSDDDVLTATSVTTFTLTASGFVATELEICNVDGANAVYYTLDGTDPVITPEGSRSFLGVLPATPSIAVIPVDGSVTVKVRSPGTPLVTVALRGA